LSLFVSGMGHEEHSQCYSICFVSMVREAYPKPSLDVKVALELSIKSSKTEYIYPQFCISLVALIR
jgi:hypothetical protein